MEDFSKLSFLSTNNYLKRSPFCGTQQITVAAGGYSEVNVDHDLGYIPFYEAFADIDNDGTIWNGGKVHPGTLSASAGPKTSPGIMHNIDTTDFRIGLFNDVTTGVTHTIQAYWLIYLDYKV